MDQLEIWYVGRAWWEEGPYQYLAQSDTSWPLFWWVRLRNPGSPPFLDNKSRAPWRIDLKFVIWVEHGQMKLPIDNCFSQIQVGHLFWSVRVRNPGSSFIRLFWEIWWAAEICRNFSFLTNFDHFRLFWLFLTFSTPKSKKNNFLGKFDELPRYVEIFHFGPV